MHAGVYRWAAAVIPDLGGLFSGTGIHQHTQLGLLTCGPGIRGPVNSELSMCNRVRLSKFRFPSLYLHPRLHPCKMSADPSPSSRPGYGVTALIIFIHLLGPI